MCKHIKKLLSEISSQNTVPITKTCNICGKTTTVQKVGGEIIRLTKLTL